MSFSERIKWIFAPVLDCEQSLFPRKSVGKNVKEIREKERLLTVFSSPLLSEYKLELCISFEPSSRKNPSLCRPHTYMYPICRMIKFSSMLYAQFLIPSTELNAYSRSSLWKPPSGTFAGSTELFLLVCCF